MNQIRSAISSRSKYLFGELKSQCSLRYLLEDSSSKSAIDVGLAPFSSSANECTSIQKSTKRLETALRSVSLRPATDINSVTKNAAGVNGISVSRQCGVVGLRSQFRLAANHGTRTTASPTFSRSFASRASRQSEQTQSQAKKDVATVEDPFDAPTYNIPEKPVTFTEGASYSLVILAGLGVAAAAGYAVFKELIFRPKEYKVFNKALKRIQDDSQVRMRIGTPIKGYGQESRNRAARQRIPNKIYTDESGVERVEINFIVRGPHGAGKVYTEMFHDKEDKQWKYTFLIVEIMSPTPAQLILESYIPA